MANRWQLATLIGAGLGLFLMLQACTSNTGTCPTLLPEGAGPTADDANGKLSDPVSEARHMAEAITTDTDFEAKVLQADKPVLVDFYADWCGPCKFLGPVIEELATELSGKADVYKVDVDKLQSVAAKFGIQSIPTVIVFSDGQAANTFVGVRGKEEYVAAINAAAGD
jgi:thioredoxin 1